MFAVDRRTQQEQIDALLSEIGDEVEIDARVDTGPAANVRDRLNQAKSDVNTSGAYGLLWTDFLKYNVGLKTRLFLKCLRYMLT